MGVEVGGGGEHGLHRINSVQPASYFNTHVKQQCYSYESTVLKQDLMRYANVTCIIDTEMSLCNVHVIYTRLLTAS